MSIALPQGITTGNWTVDSAHTQVNFSVRHAGISKVRGTFEQVEGNVEVGDSLDNTKINISIKTASINTRQDYRDNHLRSAEFFDAEQFPEITFVSTAIEGDGETFTITGDLNLHGVTKEVEFEAEFNGATVDQNGQLRAGASASATIQRKEFGLTWGHVLDNGAALVGDKIKIDVDVELVAPAAE